MEKSEIIEQLKNVKDEDRAQYELEDIVKRWTEEGVGFEAVEPILSFMESHSTWDLGMPGALTHFLERFYKKGLEEKVVSSLERRPSAHTVVALTRIINGEKDMEKKKYFQDCLENVRANPNTDQASIDTIDGIREAWNRQAKKDGKGFR